MVGKSSAFGFGVIFIIFWIIILFNLFETPMAARVYPPPAPPGPPPYLVPIGESPRGPHP